ETAVVGDDVHLYHGVTLGGTSSEPVKRHPTIGDRVILGAGAKLLGDIEIGPDSAVGANAVVVRSAPAWSTLVGIPAQIRPRRGAPGAAPAAGSESRGDESRGDESGADVSGVDDSGVNDSGVGAGRDDENRGDEGHDPAYYVI
ncbi:serine O-acetyltransferase, partial [Leucobacter sp. M11]|uniref:serine O-acetyltransferase n=1 Tax=Leucobacter sp. M11 TaxID=2993565 RepID=UPI002D9ABCD4|nr:hypothetical protein [Leucobacter sp. M11]